MTGHRRTRSPARATSRERSLNLQALALVAALLAASLPAAAQTTIKLPNNKYTPKQDVELGKEAAAEVRKQYPIIHDEIVARYLTKLGERLVAAAPARFKEPVYECSFTPLNVKDINAFALPGGPMFVNRGMIEAAADEGGVAGVMAHELSHVLLRHGTANLTKAANPWLQLGQIAGIVGGAVVGGSAGSAIIQGSQFGLGTVLLRYSRDFEKQADLLGSQIMAQAGYDPRNLAHMFETIEKQSKGGGSPQWLNSHPNPGNRTVYIAKEAGQLAIARAADTGEFAAIKPRLAALPNAKTMAEVERDARTDAGRAGGSGSGRDSATGSIGVPGQPVPVPSSKYREIRGGNVFRASVPVDWTTVATSGWVRAIPQNGYGQLDGRTVFTHGVEFGVVTAASRDLREATTLWLRGLRESNLEMRMKKEPERFQMSQRSAIETSFVNPSPLGGSEAITVSTILLADGTLFYYLTVTPEHDLAGFEDAFERVRRSIQLTNR